MTTCTAIKKMGRPVKPLGERNVAYVISLPLPLIDCLEEAIRVSGQSRSAFVRRVLEDFLKDFRAASESNVARGTSSKG